MFCQPRRPACLHRWMQCGARSCFFGEYVRECTTVHDRSGATKRHEIARNAPPSVWWFHNNWDNIKNIHSVAHISNRSTENQHLRQKKARTGPSGGGRRRGQGMGQMVLVGTDISAAKEPLKLRRTVGKTVLLRVLLKTSVLLR